jgi:hypothetical protein
MPDPNGGEQRLPARAQQLRVIIAVAVSGAALCWWFMSRPHTHMPAPPTEFPLHIANIDNLDGPIAVDDDNLYFTIRENGEAGADQRLSTRRLVSHPKRSGGTRTLLSSLHRSLFAMDDTHVYVADYDGSLPDSLSKKTVSIPAMTKTGTEIIRLAPGHENYVKAIAVDRDYVYFAGYPCVERADKLGGPSERIACGRSWVNAIALDDAYVYWLSEDPSAVVRAPKAGGDVVVVADAGRDPRALAVDKARVYWIEGDSYRDRDAGGNGRLFSVPKEGGPVLEVASALECPRTLAVDETNIYVAIAGCTIRPFNDMDFFTAAVSGLGVTGKVMAYRKVDASDTLLGPGEHEVGALAVDNKYVYWMVEDGIHRATKPIADASAPGR